MHDLLNGNVRLTWSKTIGNFYVKVIIVAHVCMFWNLTKRIEKTICHQLVSIVEKPISNCARFFNTDNGNSVAKCVCSSIRPFSMQPTKLVRTFSYRIHIGYSQAVNIQVVWHKSQVRWNSIERSCLNSLHFISEYCEMSTFWLNTKKCDWNFGPCT